MIVSRFTHFITHHAKHKALNLLSLLISSVLVLSILPANADAKAKTNKANKHQSHTATVGKSVKKDSYKLNKTNNKYSKHNKNSKSLKLRKGIKAKMGDARYKKVNYFSALPPSVGMLSGLHATPDPLALKSSVALVVDASTGEVLVEKNSTTALPIASITKLMTALIVVEARQDLNEVLTIGDADLQLEKKVRSRLGLGVQLHRRDALQLALMSSENRAANMLTRYFPGGKPAFVDAMNRKATQLSMRQSYFVEGTGLASANMASAQDLVKLIKAASQQPLIRELSTQKSLTFIGSNGRELSFHSTNRLIGNPTWDIVLQKTGFINEAGQCLVMYANLEGRSVIMVLLDSAGKLSRIGDAARVREWLATQAPSATLPTPHRPQTHNSAPIAMQRNNDLQLTHTQ